MEPPPEADPMAEQKKKFERLGDHVYELQHEEDPEAVIVFFHGLLIQETDTGHAFWSTWTKRNTLECWPVTMLPKFLESRAKREKGEESPPRPFRIRVLAVSYEGRMSVHPDIGTAGTDKYLLAESLISELILSPQDLIRGSKAVEDNDVPVFLVGHDLGGLIIKNFVMEVERTIPKKNEDADGEKLQNFLSNLKAVFFYATPHSGSQAIEYLAKQIPEDSRNQMLTLMSVLGTDMARINSVFSTYRSGIGDNLNHPRFKTYGIVPTSLTNQRGFVRTMVVLEASARCDMDTFFSVEADHFQVCQPQATWSGSITHLGDEVYDEVSKIREFEDLRIFNAQNIAAAGRPLRLQQY
ncbi:protein SERAC1 [Marchantia polymorpha subsp. ruderalis]